jgi:hypothetical protein
MRIIKATYGDRDCTNIIQSLVKDGKLVVRSNNNIVGDPVIGTTKYLKVEAEIGGKIITESVKEGELLVIPKSKSKTLGIFYSNNVSPKIFPVIRASLQSIKNAASSKDVMVDVLTCMWQNEPSNPFIEYIAWTKTHSHLNQLLQIMQLLYSARQINKYEYVSFLEHDVLYPEGYFDHPEFENGVVYTNMNYRGMNKDGFQLLGQRDEPFHQMTMRFDDAIKHCEAILPNALVTNSGLIEPQNLVRKQWECKNSAIHVNHGMHFTSHYNVYRKDKMYDVDAYWGEHSKWKYLFD